MRVLALDRDDTSYRRVQGALSTLSGAYVVKKTDTELHVLLGSHDIDLTRVQTHRELQLTLGSHVELALVNASEDLREYSFSTRIARGGGLRKFLAEQMQVPMILYAPRSLVQKVGEAIDDTFSTVTLSGLPLALMQHLRRSPTLPLHSMWRMEHAALEAHWQIIMDEERRRVQQELFARAPASLIIASGMQDNLRQRYEWALASREAQRGTRL